MEIISNVTCVSTHKPYDGDARDSQVIETARVFGTERHATINQFAKEQGVFTS